jgi:hypothetical protein
LSVAAAFVPTRTDTRAAAGHDRYCSRHGGPIGIGIVHLIRTGRSSKMEALFKGTSEP